MNDLKEQVKELIDQGNFDLARKLIKRELRKNPDDCWFLERLLTIYFETKEDRKALGLALKLCSIWPQDALRLWGCAIAYFNLGRFHDAIKCFKKILRQKPVTIILNSDLSTMHEALGLQNSCRYDIADSYESLGKYDLALKWINLHLKNRYPGQLSGYKISDVNRLIKRINNRQEFKKHIAIIEQAFNNDDWKRAVQYILIELKRTPDDVWLTTRLSTAYYEQYHYKKALKFSQKAYVLAPNDPLVIWDHAGALDGMGQKNEAIQIYKKVLRKKLEVVAYGEGGEGINWARGLINDCRYRIGQCYNDLSKPKLAIKWIQEYIDGRNSKTRSIYRLDDVRKKLREIMESNKT